MKTDQEIIQEAVNLTLEGMRVIFPVKGHSMLPFIIGGRESVEIGKPDKIKVGDIVLAWVDNNRYVVHRIIALDNGCVTLMGDGNLRGVETCQMPDVKAKVLSVVKKDGSHVDIYSPSRVLASKCWIKLLPVRRWLLAIYRRTYLKLLK